MSTWLFYIPLLTTIGLLAVALLATRQLFRRIGQRNRAYIYRLPPSAAHYREEAEGLALQPVRSSGRASRRMQR